MMSVLYNLLFVFVVVTGPSLVISRGTPYPGSPLIPATFPPQPFQNLRPEKNNFFSCVRRCGVPGHIDEFPCQCHSRCKEFRNCCEDYEPLCITCRGRCNSPFAKHAPCQCNRKCPQYENCCPDIEDRCPNSTITANTLAYYTKFQHSDFNKGTNNTCMGICDSYVDPSKPCQCNKFCANFGDCCIDYVDLCTESPRSCINRCDKYDSSKPCQCNKECKKFGNCCLNYDSVCADQPEIPENVSNAELAAISEELFKLEGPNNAASFVTVRKQGRLPNDGSDNAPELLLEINPEAYKKPTLSKMITLQDNYEASSTIAEKETAEEKQEINDFLDAILLTPIMQRVSRFLEEKGFVRSSNFRSTFQKIWFGLYSRGNGVLGSSGFEHVFLGEIKNGVSGFHHWSFFAREEKSKRLNYKGYIRQFNLGSKGMALSEGFVWRDNNKPVSSMFIGTSPEFELGLYTICWYSRPNALCPLILNGGKFKIQTYDFTYKGEKYVASAYPDV